MRTLEPAVRLWFEEGVLAAQCLPCGVYLEQEDNGDPAYARQSFLAVHPDVADGPHHDLLPAGWFRPLSGPGALSQ